VCTAGSIQRDIALAVGALLGGGSGSLLLLSQLHQSVDKFEQNEEDESCQNEVCDCGKEFSKMGTEAINPGIPIPSKDRGQKGLNEGQGERVYNGGEGGTDDDTDCHIQHVPAQSKLFKIFKKLFHRKNPFCIKNLYYSTIKDSTFQLFLQTLKKLKKNSIFS